MEAAGEKTVRKRLPHKGNVFIPLMETCLSLGLFKSMPSFEKPRTKDTKRCEAVFQGRRDLLAEYRTNLEGTSAM